MNSVELRYRLYKAVTGADSEDVKEARLVSPVPGEPVSLEVTDADGRRYRVSVEEL